MLFPLHDRVIVSPLAEPEQRSAVAELFIPSGTSRKLHRGTVVGMGEAVEFKSMQSMVQVGSTVLYEHSKGWDIYDAGEVRVMLPSSAVVAVDVQSEGDA